MVRNNFKDFGVDREAGNVGDVDLPRAVEVVEVVAAIVEAGRRDDRVIGDFATAFDSRSVEILNELARFFRILFRGGRCKCENTAGNLNKL